MSRDPYVYIFMVSIASTLWAFGCAEENTMSAPSTTSSEIDDDVRGPAYELNDYLAGPIAMRRLTRTQYIASVRAVFGPTLEVLPPTEIDQRIEGLFTVGAYTTTITPAGMERYETSARQIASTVLSPEGREQVMNCSPQSDTTPDDDCAGEFISRFAPRILRRSLKEGELASYQQLARSSSETLGDFYLGLEAALAGLLMTPEFLFIQERHDGTRQEASSDNEPSFYNLTDETLASRLSYFFWNQGPDEQLLMAASAGELSTKAGYSAQVERLIADSSNLETGLRALFTDLYELDDLVNVDKDSNAFPQFTSTVLEDAKEQTLLTITDHLLNQRADYRDLFTTRKTFITRSLGPIYNVPVDGPWSEITFDDAGERAGILTHVSFMALHSRASRSSPVLRGNFILDKILCREIPPPPPDVNFDTVADGEANAPTARERLEAHRVNPSCAACHNTIDPIGLALENFDAIGQFRTKEQGQMIETYGSIEGTSFEDVRGFHLALRDSPRVTHCMVRKLFMHAVGRPAVEDESRFLEHLDDDFAATGYDFVALMKGVALSHGFRTTSGPRAREGGE